MPMIKIKIKKILLLVFCIVLFQISLVAAQSQPDADANASQEPGTDPTTVNLLQNGQDSDTVSIDVSRLEANGEATAATYEKRQILFQRLVEEHAQGRMEKDPEDIVMNLSDAAIEDIFAGHGEGEEIDLNMAADFAAAEQQLEEQEEPDGEEAEENDDTDDEEEEIVEKESENEEEKSVLDILNEHKVAVAVVGTGIVLGGGAVSYVMKKKDDEEDGDEDDYEGYRDTKTALSLGGIAEAGALYGGEGGNIDTDEPINTADEAWSYNNCRDRVQYIDTGDQVADAANYMSDLSREAFGKEVPTWFWKTIIRCEVDEGEVLGAHFNNPGGMDYDGWMDQYCVGPVIPKTFVDNGGETHIGAKFFDIQDGIMCQVAWFCRPDAHSWWAEEINAAVNASNIEEAEHAIRLHVAQYNRGVELSDYNTDPELGDNHYYKVPYHEVFEEEYKLYIEKIEAQKNQ